MKGYLEQTQNTTNWLQNTKHVQHQHESKALHELHQRAEQLTIPAWYASTRPTPMASVSRVGSVIKGAAP